VALKCPSLQETVVLDDDSETIVGLVGKRQIPILTKNDGQTMLESMDTVRCSRGKPIPDRGGSGSHDLRVPRRRSWKVSVLVGLF
jgi:glutaredoxin 2